MLVSLNLNGKEDCKHIALNNRGEFMMNTRTGVPSTLVFGIASGIRNNGANDKFPTYTTGRVLPPIRVDDNKRTKVKVEIIHYSVTIVGDDERLIAVSDGRHTTYYFRCIGGYRDFRINEGVRSLEEAHEALVRNLFTSDKPFAYLFWGVAGEFMANYFSNNEVSISTNRLRVDGEQGFNDLKFISYNKECMNIIYSLNGMEHSVDVFTHPLLQLKSDELFNKYSLEVDQLNTAISTEQIEEVKESLEERTEEEEEVTEIPLDEKLRRAFADRSKEETLGGVVGVVEDNSEEEEEDILVEASTMDLGGVCEEETPLTTHKPVDTMEELAEALEERSEVVVTDELFDQIEEDISNAPKVSDSPILNRPKRWATEEKSSEIVKRMDQNCEQIFTCALIVEHELGDKVVGVPVEWYDFAVANGGRLTTLVEVFGNEAVCNYRVPTEEDLKDKELMGNIVMLPEFAIVNTKLLTEGDDILQENYPDYMSDDMLKHLEENGVHLVMDGDFVDGPTVKEVEGVKVKPSEPCSDIVVDIVETEDKE